MFQELVSVVGSQFYNQPYAAGGGWGASLPAARLATKADEKGFITSIFPSGNSCQLSAFAVIAIKFSVFQVESPVGLFSLLQILPRAL